MSMLKFSLYVVIGLVLPLSLATAATDPADQFLNAYFLIQEGDTAEKANDAAKAKEKFKDALEILKELKKADPSWNPHIVEYRINYCTKHLGPAAASEGSAESM